MANNLLTTPLNGLCFHTQLKSAAATEPFTRHFICKKCAILTALMSILSSSSHWPKPKSFQIDIYRLSKTMTGNTFEQKASKLNIRKRIMYCFCTVIFSPIMAENDFSCFTVNNSRLWVWHPTYGIGDHQLDTTNFFKSDAHIQLT